MWVSIISIDESTPDPGVGAVLNPVAADREFMVVRFLFPGELADDKDPPPVLSDVLNWLDKVVASMLEDSLDQWERRAETKLSIGQLSKGFKISLVGLRKKNSWLYVNDKFKIIYTSRVLSS